MENRIERGSDIRYAESQPCNTTRYALFFLKLIRISYHICSDLKLNIYILSQIKKIFQVKFFKIRAESIILKYTSTVS